ncbi:GGDEF domain-containing protein [Marinobacter sp. C2H3]|uniref:GGDEF domain-containing protein n=1 Tax=Marinobacter sp. C2H3 TaxID=3119003 RepID=UPI00300F4757
MFIKVSKGLADPAMPIGRTRLSVLIGAALILLFMIADLELLPARLHDVYVFNRLAIQLPLVLALLAFSFHSAFHRFWPVAVLLTIVGLTYANYGLIYQCWVKASFNFPYEGTLLYAFFGFFVIGLSFRYALALMLVSSIGFIALTAALPIYGDRTAIANGFVVGSLFIGVIGRYGIDSLMHQLQSANEQLVALSTTDPLTGLLNRRALMDDAGALLSVAQRSGQSVGVFMLDIDHFKQFNDGYGHQAGDRIIADQGRTLASVFQRAGDVIGRYGGEEFLVVVSGLGLDTCERKALELLRYWRGQAVANEQAPAPGIVTCSVGVCWLAPGFDVSLDEAIRQADEALYRAKARGRNAVEVVADAVSARAERASAFTKR